MPPRPAKLVRDEIRRGEIVSAARACVVRHGFHAASMQQIAQEARMSVGQIYRYFPNKEAIVHAIVERIVSQRIAWIASTGRQTDLPQVLASRMFDASSSESEDRVLLLEVTAEAARSPTVAAMVRAADRRLHAQALATVRLDHPSLTEAEAAARVEFMAVLAEGTAFRRLTDQPAETEALAALYRQVIGQLLPGVVAAGSASAAAPASPATAASAAPKRKPRR